MGPPVSLETMLMTLKTSFPTGLFLVRFGQNFAKLEQDYADPIKERNIDVSEVLVVPNFPFRL